MRTLFRIFGSMLLVAPLLAALPDQDLTTRLTKLATDLEVAAQARSNDVNNLPGWLMGSTALRSDWGYKGPIIFDAAELDRERPALKRILKSQASSNVKALALLWIGAGCNPKDLSDIEPFMEVKTPAIYLPERVILQQVAPDVFSWKRVDLNWTALKAASVITQQRFFLDGNAYRHWKEKNPDLSLSFDYWSGFARRADAYRYVRLSALESQEPELFLRVMLLSNESSYAPCFQSYGWQAPEIIALVSRNIGKERLLKILERRESWPELLDEQRFSEFSGWIFDNAECWFNDRDVSRLLMMLDNPGYQTQTRAKTLLIRAVGRLDPSRERGLLKEGLDKFPETPEHLLEVLSNRYASREASLLHKWFFTPGRDERVKCIILDGLRISREDPLPCLSKIVQDPRITPDSESVIEALARASRACIPKLDLPMFGYILVPRGKGRSASMDEKQRALLAREDCLKRIRARLADGGAGISSEK